MPGPTRVPGLTGEAFIGNLVNTLAAGPVITFTTARSLTGEVVQCRWGTVLLGNGRTEAEAAREAASSINDMVHKLEQAGHPVVKVRRRTR